MLGLAKVISTAHNDGLTVHLRNLCEQQVCWYHSRAVSCLEDAGRVLKVVAFHTRVFLHPCYICVLECLQVKKLQNVSSSSAWTPNRPCLGEECQASGRMSVDDPTQKMRKEFGILPEDQYHEI